jgi:hypothetical protein
MTSLRADIGTDDALPLALVVMGVVSNPDFFGVVRIVRTSGGTSHWTQLHEKPCTRAAAVVSESIGMSATFVTPSVFIVGAKSNVVTGNDQAVPRATR